MIRSLLFLLLALAPNAIAGGRYGVAPLNHLEAVQAWTAKAADRYWIAGENSVYYHDPSTRGGRLPFGEGRWTIAKGETYLFYGAHELPAGSREILRGGRIRLIESPEKLTIDFTPDLHGGVRPVRRNVALVEKAKKVFTSRGVSLVPEIDAAQWHQDIETLAAWNRYSYGSEIALARSWLKEEFAAIEGLVVEDYPFSMPRGENYNVIARLEGKSRPDEIYIVGAHYDSTSERTSTAAPGAEDNASGVAGLLALARVFATHPPDATILFVAFSGEEQGLYGSKAWVREAWLGTGEKSRIKAALIMDMIGYSGDDELDLLLETSTLTRPLLDDIEAANQDPELITSRSYNYWGSDHEPFLDNDIPAILFIENDYLGYPAYHRTTDTPDRIHPTLGPKVLRLMANSLAHWVYGGVEIPEESPEEFPPVIDSPEL